MPWEKRSERRTLAGGGPDLVGDYCHHEQEIYTKRPQDDEFWAFEMTARNGMLLGSHELIVFEGGQDHGFVGGGDDRRSGMRFSHWDNGPAYVS